MTLNGATVATGSGVTGTAVAIPIPNPQLWTPDTPTLYNVNVVLAGGGGDAVGTYFALRTFSIANVTEGGLTFARPLLSSSFVFLAGWLDQSWWPDGIYTAPTDAALASDLTAVKAFGLNFVRLHQKVNPPRW